MRHLLDTSVLIDVLRGKQEAVGFLADLEEVPCCSEVSRTEVLRGVRSGERRATPDRSGERRQQRQHRQRERKAPPVARERRGGRNQTSPPAGADDQGATEQGAGTAPDPDGGADRGRPTDE